MSDGAVWEISRWRRALIWLATQGRPGLQGTFELAQIISRKIEQESQDRFRAKETIPVVDIYVTPYENVRMVFHPEKG